MINLGIYARSRLHSFVAKSKEFGFYFKSNKKTLEGFKLGSDPGLSRVSVGLRGEEAGEGAGW